MPWLYLCSSFFQITPICG